MALEGNCVIIERGAKWNKDRLIKRLALLVVGDQSEYRFTPYMTDGKSEDSWVLDMGNNYFFHIDHEGRSHLSCRDWTKEDMEALDVIVNRLI